MTEVAGCPGGSADDSGGFPYHAQAMGVVPAERSRDVDAVMHGRVGADPLARDGSCG